MSVFLVKTLEVRRNCIAAIEALNPDKTWRIEIRPYKHKRTISQNALYWMWLKEIAMQRYDAGHELKADTEYHRAFRQLFLGVDTITLFGIESQEPKSTTKLNVTEFKEYLENIEHYVGSEEGITLSHPEDLYYEAMK